MTSLPSSNPKVIDDTYASDGEIDKEEQKMGGPTIVMKSQNVGEKLYKGNVQAITEVSEEMRGSDSTLNAKR